MQVSASETSQSVRVVFCGTYLTVHYTIKYGISIPDTTQIGSGFYIGHFGEIVVNSKAISLARTAIFPMRHHWLLNRGERAGSPIIGNNVFIGPGAKILGLVNVGDGAAIGANCVVVSDVPPNSVIVGVPGRVVSQDGSAGYINHTDYE